MKLTLAEPKYLKDSISIISELITEARFQITKQSMKVVAMDPANVAMVVFELFSSSFTSYELEEDAEFTISLGYFKQILKRAGASDTVTLELEGEKLNITIAGKSKRTFSIAVLESDDREQKIPSLQFAVTVNAPCTVLNGVVDDAAVIMADSISFGADAEKVNFIAESDLNKVKIDLDAAEDVVIKNEETATVKAKYSLEYLKKVATGAKLADTVKFSFSNDYPLKVEYSEVDKVHVEFILAPRVEND